MWCSNDAILQRKGLRFFCNIFCFAEECVPDSLVISSMPSLSDRARETLLIPVSKEVYGALMSMDSYKAPRPDGFHPIFFNTNWDIVGNEVWQTISKTFFTGVVDLVLAETLVVLILKVDPPTQLKELRPISLCNVVLKLISKELVLRIRPFLNDIVSPLQSSFISGR